MLLGKRPRPPIRRTTSMTGITVDLDLPTNLNAPETPDDQTNPMMIRDRHDQQPPRGSSCADTNNNNNNNNNSSSSSSSSYGLHEYDQRFLAATMLSPRNLPARRNSADDFLETAHFLRTCGLCHRRLAPGKDIYMYRGDTAFCSLECREKQMKHDERKEKCHN